MKTENEVIDQIEKALEASENRKIRLANESFRNIYASVHKHPLLLWNNPRVYLLGKAFMVMYHSDLFESEEQNIELAHLSLFYLQRSEDLCKDGFISDSTILFETLRIQAVLFKTCEDCYIESVATFYQPHNHNVNADEKHGSVLLATRVMLFVLYSVLVEITDSFDGFKGDAYLDDICKTIELENPTISNKLLKEGNNVRKLLYTYCKAKIAKMDFNFMS